MCQCLKLKVTVAVQLLFSHPMGFRLLAEWSLLTLASLTNASVCTSLTHKNDFRALQCISIMHALFHVLFSSTKFRRIIVIGTQLENLVQFFFSFSFLQNGHSYLWFE